MSTLTIGKRLWAHSVVAINRGERDSETIYTGVEFILDGISLSSQAGLGISSGYVTIFDAISPPLARSVLLGNDSVAEHFPSQGRIPLIFCSCGDPTEGALTARLSIDRGTVRWDQWAWEHDSFPSEALPDFPIYRFLLDEYENALDQAMNTALNYADIPSSMIRARFPGDGLISWITRKTRGELAYQLSFTEIDIIKAPADIDAPGFQQLIRDIRSIRTVLAACVNDRRSLPSTKEIEQVRVLVDDVLASDEVFRLPLRTTQALNWLRQKL